MPLIAMRDVNFGFGGPALLEDINFLVEPGNGFLCWAGTAVVSRLCYGLCWADLGLSGYTKHPNSKSCSTAGPQVVSMAAATRHKSEPAIGINRSRN